jgi:hypothetical protein
MMETENKKKRPSSYEDFMNAHEYIFNEKRLNWRNSITNNLLHQKNISKYEKLKINVLNRIKKNFETMQHYQNENNGKFEKEVYLDL